MKVISESRRWCCPLSRVMAQTLNSVRSTVSSFERRKLTQVAVPDLVQIVFPIPEICEYLTEETKHKVRVEAELDDQGSKVSDFFERTDYMFDEMRWQVCLL